MNIYDACKLTKEFGLYSNIKMQVRANTSTPDYEVLFLDHELAFGSLTAFATFMDAIELEKEYLKQSNLLN